MSSDWTSISSPGSSGAQAEANTTNAGAPPGPPGPPYPIAGAVVGGVPTMPVDDPVSAVLAFFFIVGAGIHMGIFQFNRKHGHLFVFSAMMFAFCLIRAAALVMRMVWASNLRNVNVAMAANILTQAGTVIVFVINLFFAQRIVRGYHPKFGWSTPARVVLRLLVGSCIACLLMVIIATIQYFFTLDEGVRRSCRIVQLFSGSYLMVLAFIPIPIVLIAALAPRDSRVEKFGEGSWSSKLLLVTFTSTLLTIGAGFRVGTNYYPRAAKDPAWYHHQAAFYIFNFVFDIIVTYVYIGMHFHKRFHVPNGAKGPGSYSVIKSYSSDKPSRPGSCQSSRNSKSPNKKPHPGFNRFSGDQTLRNDSDAALSFTPDLPPGVKAYMRYAELGDSPYDHRSYGGDTTDVDAESQHARERVGLALNGPIIKVSSHNGSSSTIHKAGTTAGHTNTGMWMPTLPAEASGGGAWPITVPSSPAPPRSLKNQPSGRSTPGVKEHSGRSLRGESSWTPLIAEDIELRDSSSRSGAGAKGEIGEAGTERITRASQSAPGSSSVSVRTRSRSRTPRRKSGFT
ncbi:uncharacterized protein BCR38DRAFT_190352 [Pseudomassariella vexata]|uniref:Uncharacterized protein n=1 Tax=Pseudomassariella vexata TaxID=1141098 RepID=A0A1Y2E0I5_9PEZI|nr:uncharacterized protein BCR38DRAFT_190352 [Pseudomassariella vexata]ORY65058.1 hypothetical protein BCR38DRAFT_190352 [Pseudomassariella vexata]